MENLSLKYKGHNKYLKSNQSQSTKQNAEVFDSQQNAFSFLNVIKFSLPIRRGNQSSFSQPAKEINSEHFQNSSVKAITENGDGRKQKKIYGKARSEKNTMETPYNTETDDNDNISTFDEFKGKQKKIVVGKQGGQTTKKVLSEDKSTKFEYCGQEKVSQKLNLGLKKKKGEKGKIKQFMQNILARTKIDEVVTIKKSPFQIEQQQHSPRISRDLHPENSARKVTGSLNSAVRIKRPFQNGVRQKNSGMKLPNIHENKKILAMVKEQERRRQKCGQNEELGRRQAKGQALIREIYKETIPQQIQYASVCKESPTKNDQIIQEDFNTTHQ